MTDNTEVEREEIENEVTLEAAKNTTQAVVEQSVLRNFVEFELEGKFYKVTRPTTAQKQEAYQKKLARYMQLMKEKDEKGEYRYFPEKQLRKIYKDRGLDINDMDTMIKQLELKRKDYQEKLGKALTERVSDNELDIFRNEIVALNLQISELYTDKNNLLESSLENQSMAFLYEYLTYLIVEIKNEKGEYETAFKSFEEFRKADNLVTNSIGMYSGLLFGSL